MVVPVFQHKFHMPVPVPTGEAVGAGTHGKANVTFVIDNGLAGQFFVGNKALKTQAFPGGAGSSAAEVVGRSIVGEVAVSADQADVPGSAGGHHKVGIVVQLVA